MQTATGPSEVARMIVIGNPQSLNAINVEKTVRRVYFNESNPVEQSLQSMTKNRE